MATNIIFLHHSTGGVIWNGGVADWFTAYNTEHETDYQITAADYPDTGGGYEWANYPYDYWNLWVNHTEDYLGEHHLDYWCANYDVIVFKFCFPVTDMLANSEPDITSSVKSDENYRLQLAAVKAELLTHPTKKFLVWTGAAERVEDTTEANATRAKTFFQPGGWFQSTWDVTGDNIFLWDFRTLETDGGLYLTPAHASTDSHPNGTFAAEVAPLFCQRLVDVIEGIGDGVTVHRSIGRAGRKVVVAG